MNRELALKIVLALVGLLFLALVFPLTIFMRQEPALSMMLSLYVTLGVFLRVCSATGKWDVMWWLYSSSRSRRSFGSNLHSESDVTRPGTRRGRENGTPHP
jgi:membrane-bound metal-dependent hydrolase YbcI (DUF457 family)